MALQHIRKITLARTTVIRVQLKLITSFVVARASKSKGDFNVNLTSTRLIVDLYYNRKY